MTAVCAKHRVAVLRELICLFFSTSDLPKRPSEAMEVWLCRHQLVDDFKDWVIKRGDYVVPECFHNFKLYVDILERIETLYRKINGLPHLELIDRKRAEEAELMERYSFLVTSEKKLKEEEAASRAKMQELQATEKLHRLQLIGDSSELKFAKALQRFSNEQETRVRSIK